MSEARADDVDPVQRRQRLLRAAALFYAALTLAALAIGVFTEESLVWRKRPEHLQTILVQLGLGLLLGALIIVASNAFTRLTGRAFPWE